MTGFVGKGQIVKEDGEKREKKKKKKNKEREVRVCSGMKTRIYNLCGF